MFPSKVPEFGQPMMYSSTTNAFKGEGQVAWQLWWVFTSLLSFSPLHLPPFSHKCTARTTICIPVSPYPSHHQPSNLKADSLNKEDISGPEEHECHHLSWITAHPDQHAKWTVTIIPILDTQRMLNAQHTWTLHYPGLGTHSSAQFPGYSRGQSNLTNLISQ
jgi:hypothetical protein